MGQRQLICLARAILKNNRILISDEATANVDQETDNLVQRTIRSRFADCTVIAIAHRLHSILDSDRIMVMDAGRIAEFDTVENLMKIPNGIFLKLFQESGLSMEKG
jgi:ABC-type multidrug transport system fused ATPase/permease subunit